MINAVREFGVGVGLLARGFRLVLSSGSMLLKGAVPALLSSLVLFGGLVALAVNLGDLVSWMTPFADGWSQTWQTILRIGVGISVAVLAVAVSVLVFGALTLIIGGPFYESIAEQVEDTELGGVPSAQQVGWGRSAWIGVRDAVLLIARIVLWGIVLFALGFVPVVGQVVVPVLAVLVGAWLLAVELTAIPFVRRGQGLKERRRALKGRRAMTLGFGTPVYLLCLIPLAALVVFPAAMAGGTLLAHRALTEPR
ncbi:EI24 domain-containing protein [Actinokineospora fastidiosa]|uniref:EI24 domain-containing protein n=1 Tax=Actinokineospora fastidiosa TaxID=1816 RepID=UPI001E5A2207|nr:EI24 domain-containing protein [Actinokineospora fastidiosa]